MSVKLFTFALVAIGILGLCSAGGRRQYQEDCLITQQLLNFVRSDDSDDPNTCETNKKLLCIRGRCDCAPGFVYENNGIFSWLPWSRGECLVRALLPCNDDSLCVTNSKCRSYTCQCERGYQSQEGHCISGAIKVSMSPFYVLGLVVSYFVLNH